MVIASVLEERPEVSRPDALPTSVTRYVTSSAGMADMPWESSIGADHTFAKLRTPGVSESVNSSSRGDHGTLFE
jgi:hypothetical protein